MLEVRSQRFHVHWEILIKSSLIQIDFVQVKKLMNIGTRTLIVSFFFYKSPKDRCWVQQIFWK